MRRPLLLPALASAFVCFVVSAFAGPIPPTNQLYGFISSNRTLTYAYPGPVYEVPGDVVVMPGVTLTIEPGVTLHVATNDALQGGDYPSLVEFDVQGTLAADGSTGDSIRVVDAGGQWGQIRVHSAGHLVLRKAVVRGPRMAILSEGIVEVDDSQFIECFSGLDLKASTGHLRNSLVSARYDSRNAGGAGLWLSSTFDTSPVDSTAPTAITIARFRTGLMLKPPIAISNFVVRDCDQGLVPSDYGDLIVRYCTFVRNGSYGVFFSSSQGTLLNSIVGSGGYGVFNGYVAHSDVWSNSTNFYGCTFGPSLASFNPFFVDPANNDFHLADNSIFKYYSNSFGEIGAYGPGSGPPTEARRSSWGRVKALYR